MAHKNLVGGTAYDTKGGKDLVDGTAYSIKNGRALVDGTGYDISFGIQAAFEDLWDSEYFTAIHSVAYGNGYWVVGGEYYNESADKSYARIAYTTSLGGTWTIKNLWGNAYGDNAIYCVTYANGYWVAGGTYVNSSYVEYARISYATDPTGTWTGKNVWTSDNSSSITGIAYGDGYWVAVGMASGGDTAYPTYSAHLAYNTKLSGTWTEVDLWSDDDTGTNTYNCNRLSCVAYGNGYWVVGGMALEGYSDLYARIAYTTNPAGTWTQKDIWEGQWIDSERVGSIGCVTYDNGYWVVGGVRYPKADTYTACIGYTKDPTGDWTVEDLWNSGTSNAPSYVDWTTVQLHSIAYGDGYWIACGTIFSSLTSTYGCNAYIAYAKTKPSATWTKKSLWHNKDAQNEIYDAVYGDGAWLVGGVHCDGSTCSARIAYAETPSELVGS